MSEQIKDGGLAFPAKVSVNRDTGDTQPYQFGNNDFYVGGMTLRQYYTAKALHGLLANPGGPIQPNSSFGWGFINCSADDVAGLAMDIADSVIARETKS